MTIKKRTQVCIIGSGPSGLLLSQTLYNSGIDSIILDRQSSDGILSRIRAGVLEWGAVEALQDAGVGERMMAEGIPHSGFEIAYDEERLRIDLEGLTGKQVMVYGQTEITKDLIDNRLRQGCEIVFSAEKVQPHNVTDKKPTVTYEKDGKAFEIECDYIAGCDGYHGVSRKMIPADILKTYERIYPFGWLGVMVEKPPVAHELIYASHERGFALCSMRSETRSRYYVQCSLNDNVEDWSDQRFWDELAVRIGPETALKLQTGDSFEKSIAPLRSFVAEPMRHGNLFLAGDAAHIVPPTGAKGLNLAVSDVRLLSRGLIEKYANNTDTYIDTYSKSCLKRVWKAERFSWWMSTMLHKFDDYNGFDKKMQRAEFDNIVDSEAAQRNIAENYVGYPLD